MSKHLTLFFLFLALIALISSICVVAEDAEEAEKGDADDKDNAEKDEAGGEEKEENAAEAKPEAPEVKQDSPVKAEEDAAVKEDAERANAAPVQEVAEKEQQPDEGADAAAEPVDIPVAQAGAAEVANPRAARSLLQACRGEITRVCPEKRAIVKCLSTKVDQVTDPICKTWIGARDLCTKAATASGKCTAKDSPRQCLRKVPEADLPAECTASDFYKSVKMFSMFRRNPGAGGFFKRGK